MYGLKNCMFFSGPGLSVHNVCPTTDHGVGGIGREWSETGTSVKIDIFPISYTKIRYFKTFVEKLSKPKNQPKIKKVWFDMKMTTLVHQSSYPPPTTHHELKLFLKPEFFLPKIFRTQHFFGFVFMLQPKHYNKNSVTRLSYFNEAWENFRFWSKFIFHPSESLLQSSNDI